ncbi:MAG: glycosyltransferase [Acidimicrobiales bacterium]
MKLASSDGTLDVVERVRAQYPHRHVIVVSEPDQGISDAMNKGVLRTTGDLLVHLHAGDRFVDPSVIDRVVESYQVDGWRWGVASSIAVDEGGVHRHLYRPDPDHRSLLT